MKPNYWVMKPEVMSARIQRMRSVTEEIMSLEELPHLSFSEGNRKTDSLVPSISLRPILDCGNCSQCSKSCYDFRNDLRFDDHYRSRAKNYVVWKKNPKLYFEEISLFCKRKVSFRWHIGGDDSTLGIYSVCGCLCVVEHQSSAQGVFHVVLPPFNWCVRFLHLD